MSMSNEEIVKELNDAKCAIAYHSRQINLLKEAFRVKEKEAFYAAQCAEILAQRLADSENERKILVAAITYSCKNGGSVEDILRIVTNDENNNSARKSDSSEDGRSLFSQSSPILTAFTNSTMTVDYSRTGIRENILSEMKTNNRNKTA